MGRVGEGTGSWSGHPVPSLLRTLKLEDTLFRAQISVSQPHPPRVAGAGGAGRDVSASSVQGGDLCPGLRTVWLL